MTVACATGSFFQYYGFVTVITEYCVWAWAVNAGLFSSFFGQGVITWEF